jgi:hypothetical protein
MFLASMLTVAMSLTITPNLRPRWSGELRRCVSAEVFPVPRNPERSVMGTAAGGSPSDAAAAANPGTAPPGRLEKRAAVVGFSLLPVSLWFEKGSGAGARGGERPKAAAAAARPPAHKKNAAAAEEEAEAEAEEARLARSANKNVIIISGGAAATALLGRIAAPPSNLMAHRKERTSGVVVVVAEGATNRDAMVPSWLRGHKLARLLRS